MHCYIIPIGEYKDVPTIEIYSEEYLQFVLSSLKIGQHDPEALVFIKERTEPEHTLSGTVHTDKRNQYPQKTTFGNDYHLRSFPIY